MKCLWIKKWKISNILIIVNSMQNTGMGIVSKRKFKKQCENYIFELFKILQCKTENEFRKNQLFEPKGEF